MSERPKGDTSSSLLSSAALNSSGRVVKNPLLSASVTGLTFDDFQNKPLLLPAAPPIVHPAPVVVSRESTPLVTVGKSSDIDTENLSEINLNDTSATSSSNIADTSDENSNSLIESTNQIDNSILSQAASSFSQLPSVASSVFSTFSKKFNSSSGRGDYNSNSQLDIQPFTTPFVGQASLAQPQQILPPPSAFDNQQHHPQQQLQQQIGLPPRQHQAPPSVEPPTFYSPTEVPSAPSGNTGPRLATGQNTYRLSAKKKIYAQIPGLSSAAQHQESALPTAAGAAATTTGFPPPIGFESFSAPVYSTEHSTSYDKPEEPKGGLFSNLGVPNVLQNLSGFVQSATGISQRPQEQPSLSNFGTIQSGQSSYYPQANQTNFSGIEQIEKTASTVNFFTPPGSSGSQSLSQVAPLPTAPPLVPFADVQQFPLITGAPFTTFPPKSKTPEATNPFFAQQQTIFQRTTSASPPPSVGNQLAGSASVTGVLFPAQPEALQPQQASYQPSASLSRPPSVGNHCALQPAKSLTPDIIPSFKAFAPQQALKPELNSEITLPGPLPTKSDTTASGPPQNLFSPPTTGNNFPGPPPSSSQAAADSLGPLPASGTNFPGTSSKSATPELSLNSEQASAILTPDLFRPPSTTGVNFSGPQPKSTTPVLNLTSVQSTSAATPDLFRPPSTAGANFSGPTTESNLVSQQASSATTPDLFRPPSTYLSGPKSESNLVSQQDSSVAPTPDLFRPPPTAGFNVSAPPIQTVHPVLFAGPPTSIIPQANSSFKPLDPPQYSGPPPTALAAPISSTGIPVHPETQLPPPQIKPPSTGPPSTSFRLQKGTRLYKSPFAVNPTEYQSSVQVSQNNFPTAPPQAIPFFNPQQAFVPPQAVPQQIPPSQETILKPLQETSILPPKSNTYLPPPPSLTTPPLSKTTDHHPSTAGAVNFFNPQGFSSGQGILDLTTLAAPLNILEPSVVAPEAIPTKPPVQTFNFFNPQALNSVPGLLGPSKGVAQFACPSEVSTKPPLEQSTNLFTPQEIIPPSATSTETVDNPEKLPQQTSVASSEQSSVAINPKPQAKQETLLQEQQNNILPPPPAVNFGTSTPSKETANFPPPPPHQSFQNKPVSNPYRKGLQSAHSQAPAPTSLSSFFNPIEKGNNFFQTISSAPIAEAPQPAVHFFAETSSVIAQEKPVNPLPDTVNAPEQQPEAPKVLGAHSIPLKNQQQQQQQLKTDLSEPEGSLPIREPTPVSSEQSEKLLLTPKAQENSSPTPEAVENPLSFYKPNILQPTSSSNDLPVASKPEESSKIASPIKSQDAPVPEPVPNSLTGFFDQAAAPAPVPATPIVATPNPIHIQRPSLPDPTTFFDSFSLVPTLGVAAPPSEDPNSQRIQNFFNNPPPKELDTVGDLNYNLVGSGLSVQNLQIRSLTPASNLAEPPSSSCSDFSELNSSLSAANRQPLIQAADSTKVSPEEEAIFESPEYQDLPEEIVNELKMANSMLGNSSPTNETTYKPAVKHWFYKRKLDVKCLWTPFSFHDSALLEEAFLKGDEGPNLVAVEGGRFDVNISERTKTPVYWEGEPIQVKRCSWFYKANDSKYVPYEEETADLLEEEYKKASESCEWHKKIPISAGDIIVFHGPTVIVHFQPQQQIDSWGGSTLDSENFLSYMKQQTITRPRVVKRDLDDFHIDEGESHKVDHLLFMVHGIGSACDLKMRSVEEVVDEFRSIALQLVQSHYKNSVESGFVGRVEVLPVSWHSELHSDELGIDEKLKSITLESIPKLRNFTNDTLLDILFYTSPMFCQRIINTVTASMNSIFVKYKQRNPEFQGGVSLAGHSLGSLIMFDLLCHQRPIKESEDKNMENPDEMTSSFPVESSKLNEEAGQNITYKMGQAGTGQPFISYPQLLFQPKKFFALGSPIGMFVTIRGIDKLGLDFRLPTCPGFYNIFHPYDPVAYRLEALVNPDMNGIPPVLIPHHKGRKRMHLELKETMSRVGADLKQRFFETFKTTFESVNFLTPKIKNDPKELETEVDKLLELKAHKDQQKTEQSTASTSRSRANSNSTNQSDTDVIEIDFPLGKLNDSKRVDYVLQEAPLEFFNEYLFALSSHVCYWESEDTILFVMKQIYNGIGISTDSQVPQQTMTIERPSSSGGSTTQQSPTS